ncbi:hypothetical protein [Caudoviricetes sp.]|nr:hypothetical protein [Caudoviricetes sp.]
MADVWGSFSSGAQTGLGLMEAYKGKLQEEESKKYLADAATALTTSDDTAQQAPGAQAPAPVTEVAKAPVGQGGLTAGQGMGPQAYAKTQPQQATEAPKGFDTGAAALTPPQMSSPRINATIQMAMRSGASPKTIDQLMQVQKWAKVQDSDALISYNTNRLAAMEDLSRQVSLAGSEADMYSAISRSAFGRDPNFMKQVSAFLSDPRMSVAEKRTRLEEYGLTSKERVTNELNTIKAQNSLLKGEMESKNKELDRLSREGIAARAQSGLKEREIMREDFRQALALSKQQTPKFTPSEIARTQRGLTGANIVAGSLETITSLPEGATTGLVSDLTSKQGMTNAVVSAGVRGVSSDEAKAMTTAFAGIGRGLAAVETGGLATGLAELSKQMQDASYIKPGDSAYSVAMKLADTRRIIDDAITIQIEAGTMPEKQAKAAQEVLDRVHKIVPYTTLDVADAIKNKSGKAGTVGQKSEKVVNKFKGSGTKEDPIKLD